MGKKLKLNLRFYILGIALVIIVIVVFVIKMSSGKNPDGMQPANTASDNEIETTENHNTPDEINTELSNSDNKDNSDFDISTLPEIPLPQSTVSDLTSKGMPLMPYGRKVSYEQTAEQTISEIIADLGNNFMIGFTRNPNFRGSYGNISSWSNDITSNLKVLRLIEEGRNNNSEIAILLEKAISENLKYYEDTYQSYQDKLAAFFNEGESPNILSMEDEYYEKNKRYSNPLFEMSRILHVIYSSFYILANTGEFDNPKLLSNWIDFSSKYNCGCYEMDIWLIDQFFKNNSSSFAQNHKQLVGEQYISGRSIEVSKWNALWDINDPMIAAMKVDISDIQTIEILEIPLILNIEVKKGFAIHDNFQSYCKEME